MRSWTDKQVSSHLAFLPSIPIVIFYRDPPFWEQLCFIIPLAVLSTLYHLHHEPVGSPLARIELCSAFLLYVNGCAQLWNSLFLSTRWGGQLLMLSCTQVFRLY